ncbi:aspartate kinase [Anthocerotibacter panamensis]|uniref:aspartate kinase n=1 Tax=Anthocerotibacter panamensis TaxID=2857077 RepID=UPI001C405753|nr:aspartate kinase [Anthocerotibacter panamensis]
MGLIVQKFGGTSVSDRERIGQVARRVADTVRQGYEVVVVVSAMGHETDRLMDLAQSITAHPNQRELDVLLSTGEQVSIALVAMALHELGLKAVSLTGVQVGIVTESNHNQARILNISTQRLRQHLDQGEVVVVAGFQGVSLHHPLEVTTLGRGGSDTTAVALAAALGALKCEIYTDVAGVYTTDPRIVPSASLLPEITSEEMLELASLGAQVLHPRAVEIAKNYGVAVIVRCNWANFPGTRVIFGTPRLSGTLKDMEIARPVDRVEVDPCQAKIALLRVPDRPGVAQKLFQALADERIDIDLIIQSIHSEASNDIAFTVQQGFLPSAAEIAHRVGQQLGCSEVTLDADIAKISLVGVGVRSRAGVAAQMFATLARLGVNIQMISTSEIKLSCVIGRSWAAAVKAALEEAFGLPPSGDVPPAPPLSLKAVRGVALDRDQARIAVQGIPDRPGMAAKLLERLAQGGIPVDMIIQSQRAGTEQDIALTVPRSQAVSAQTVLNTAARDLGCREVTLAEHVVKVSAVGEGMIGTPGIAACMFAALAYADINIQMISTSDIKVSCVVNEAHGGTALQVVHAAFDLQSPASALLQPLL